MTACQHGVDAEQGGGVHRQSGPGNMAAETTPDRQKLMAATLISLGRRWGAELVAHYGWERRTLSFVRKLLTAANKNSDWKTACTKFNRILLRRQMLAKLPDVTLKAGPIKDSVDPIENNDITHLTKWRNNKDFQIDGSVERVLSFRAVESCELQPHLNVAFDKFGLLVIKNRGFEPGVERLRLPATPPLSHTFSEEVNSPQPDHNLNNYEPTVDSPNLDSIIYDCNIDIHDRTYGIERQLLQTPALGTRARMTMDNEILLQVKRDLEEKLTVYGTGSRGQVDGTLMLSLIDRLEQPRFRSTYEQEITDALLLSEEGAKEVIENGSPKVPIICQDVKCFRWPDRERPILEFLHRQAKDDRKIFVQDPSLAARGRDSARPVELREITERLSADGPAALPYNALEIPCTLEISPPLFVQPANAALLPMVRELRANPAQIRKINGNSGEDQLWKEKSRWVLVSEGGTFTTPHTDTMGSATWISVQEGDFVLAWMVAPTPDEAAKWTEHCAAETGRWCYAVLKAGDTVFMPSGTVHAVLRMTCSQTLAFGGHVLLWSDVRKWVELLKWQHRFPKRTNEKDCSDFTKRIFLSVCDLVNDFVDKNNSIYAKLIGGDEGRKEFNKIAVVRSPSVYPSPSTPVRTIGLTNRSMLCRSTPVNAGFLLPRKCSKIVFRVSRRYKKSQLRNRSGTQRDCSRSGSAAPRKNDVRERKKDRAKNGRTVRDRGKTRHSQLWALDQWNI